MVSCNESSQSDAGGVASYPLTRAGLRQPPRGAEPTGAFVVIEMAVLSCVSALAMVSIIVSIDDGVTGQNARQSTRIEERARLAVRDHGVVVPMRQEASVAQPAVARVAQ